MAKKLIKDVMPRNFTINVCKASKKLLEDICTKCQDDWVFALHEGWQKYCLDHSDVQSVVFTATLAIHEIKIKDDGIHVDFYPMPIMVRKVENFSCYKKAFKVRLRDTRKDKDEFKTLVFTLN